MGNWGYYPTYRGPITPSMSGLPGPKSLAVFIWNHLVLAETLRKYGLWPRGTCYTVTTSIPTTGFSTGGSAKTDYFVHLEVRSQKLSGAKNEGILSLIFTSIFWGGGFSLTSVVSYTAYIVGEDSSILGTWNVGWYNLLSNKISIKCQCLWTSPEKHLYLKSTKSTHTQTHVQEQHPPLF